MDFTLNNTGNTISLNIRHAPHLLGPRGSTYLDLSENWPHKLGQLSLQWMYTYKTPMFVSAGRYTCLLLWAFVLRTPECADTSWYFHSSQIKNVLGQYWIFVCKWNHFRVFQKIRLYKLFEKSYENMWILFITFT